MPHIPQNDENEADSFSARAAAAPVLPAVPPFWSMMALLALVAPLLAGCQRSEDVGAPGAMVDLKVGHVGHDHHTALFVALDNASEFAEESGISVQVIEDRKFYELWDRGEKVANLGIVKVGGGSKMPTAVAQGVIDVGLGGVAAVLASIDSGAPVRLVAPLHSKGDLFVVRTDFPATTWREFVEIARTTDRPLRIGYKNPMAVAKLVFEQALQHEGIVFGGDLARAGIQVHMINVKGEEKLNVSLATGLIDGYAGNNPFPAIAEHAGVGRVVCEAAADPGRLVARKPGNDRFRHPQHL